MPRQCLDPARCLHHFLVVFSGILAAAETDALTCEQAVVAGTAAQRKALGEVLAEMGFRGASRMRSPGALGQTLRQLHAKLAGRTAADGRYLQRVDGRPVSWRVGVVATPSPAGLEERAAEARRRAAEPVDW